MVYLDCGSRCKMSHNLVRYAVPVAVTDSTKSHYEKLSRDFCFFMILTHRFDLTKIMLLTLTITLTLTANPDLNLTQPSQGPILNKNLF